MDSLTRGELSFYNVYVDQIMTVDTINILHFHQLSLNTAEKKEN